MDTCAQCGAVSRTPCQELFQQLLALDHSQQEPWGPLHGVAFACYRIQHPNPLAEAAHEFTLGLLRAHLAGGDAASRKLTERARHGNSHRVRRERRAPTSSASERPSGFAFTIAEVAVNGGFPAEGHPERVRAWARAALAAWAA